MLQAASEDDMRLDEVLYVTRILRSDVLGLWLVKCVCSHTKAEDKRRQIQSRAQTLGRSGIESEMF